MKKNKKECIVLILFISICIFFTGCGDPEMKEAKEAYEEQVQRIEQQIDDREKAIKEAEMLLKSDEIPLNKTIETSLQKTIDIAKADDIEIPKRPREIKEIYETVELMKGLDITEQINDLKNMQDELKDSSESAQIKEVFKDYLKSMSSSSSKFLLEKFRTEGLRMYASFKTTLDIVASRIPA